MKRSFSPSDAAFEGFRVVQRYPGAVAIWTLLYLVLAFGSLYVVRTTFGADWAQAVAASRADPKNPTLAMAMFSHIAPLFLILMPLSMVFHAIYSAAVYRAVLRPEDKGVGFLKLSADEFRQIGLYLYVFGMLILAYIALILVIVAGALGAAALTHVGASHNGGLMIIAMIVGYLVLACAAIWVTVRLSLASAATFARRRIQLFSTWRLTKGNFWSLLGCYILMAIFVLLVGVLSWVVSVCAGAIITGDWTPLSHMPSMTDPKAMMNGITTAIIIQTLVSGLFGAVIRAIQLAPSAAAYGALTYQGDPDEYVVKSGGLVL